jgi:hypothetical protein
MVPALEALPEMEILLSVKFWFWLRLLLRSQPRVRLYLAWLVTFKIKPGEQILIAEILMAFQRTGSVHIRRFHPKPIYIFLPQLCERILRVVSINSRMKIFIEHPIPA